MIRVRFLLKDTFAQIYKLRSIIVVKLRLKVSSEASLMYCFHIFFSSTVAYLKPRRLRREEEQIRTCVESIVVYLNSPRPKCENNNHNNMFWRYRCVYLKSPRRRCDKYTPNEKWRLKSPSPLFYSCSLFKAVKSDMCLAVMEESEWTWNTHRGWAPDARSQSACVSVYSFFDS